MTAVSTATIATAVEPSDRVLLQALRRGDERAFEALFVRHFGAVHGVVVRVTGDPEAAEELALDAFLKLYRQPLADADDTNIRGWLLRVATNAGFNAVRSRNRRTGWFRRLAGRAESPVEGMGDPGEIVAQLDEARRVRERLAELPERQRNALVLRSSGLAYAEIASALGVSPGSVGTILARAERAFRERYRQDGGNDHG